MSLSGYRKDELCELAENLGVEILSTDKVIAIIKKIEASDDYEKEIAIAQIKLIREERLKKEEREEKERLKKEEREEKERLKREEREEKEKERQHEIEKLRITQLNETVSIGSERGEREKVVSFKNIIQNFNPEKSEISLYLDLFERQAEKLGVPEDQYITHLLPLIPIQLAEVILREPKPQSDDYQYIKKILLSRFRINAESFRLKFTQNQRQPAQLWRDFKHDLNMYLDGWLNGLEIKDFESLKKLLLVDQIKKRTSPEIREHFIDIWAEIIDPEELTKKLDDYESVRKFTRKNVMAKTIDDRKIDRQKSNEKPRDVKMPERKPFNWREKNQVDQKERERAFEKRKAFSCYECNSTTHLRLNCPKLQRRDYKLVNNVGISEHLNESFKPYLSTAKINNVETVILRDTGTSMDLVSRRLITPQNLNGETVWVKQALENAFHCLAVANVELEIEGVGLIKTKAAVVDPSINMDHYLLGNQTQEIIDNIRERGNIINAVVTRSQLKTETKCQTQGIEDPPVLADVTDEGVCDLPPVHDESEVGLTQINYETFKSEQKKDLSLKGLWEKGKDLKNKEYFIEREILFRETKDHHGNSRKQLIVPVRMRENILTLCHHGIGGHMGNTKTKDKILRYYFWPNAIKEIETFVKTCDSCQKVGKPGEAKRAPLKLVPIIQEIFSRINCDLVGPLPESDRQNKYILTAICLSSKYPEAIPVRDTKSDTVIEALLTVFSRVGFPREIQCDLGSCFISELTTTFCEKFGMKIVHSSVRHPQSHAIERWHRSVKRLLKVLCLESGKTWEKTLPMALLALRTVTHESTGFSPAELVHGKNLRTPETLLFEKWTGQEEEGNLVTEYVFELINRMKRCQELAVERMEQTRDKRKEWYDRGTVTRKFKPGDQVLVMATVRPNKLSVTWLGPGTIEKQISETNYVVSVPGRREKSQIYHVNLIKPYHRRVELVNILLREDLGKDDADLEIVYPTEIPNVYDFNEIVRDNALEEKFPPDKIEQLKTVLSKHQKLFSNEPGRTDLVQHDIELITDKPFRIKPYRMSPRQNEILKQEIQRMLELKLIEVGESDYTSPMILVEAPGKDPRPCVDFRRLNSLTKTEFFPLPNIEERVEQVAAAKFISLCDLTKGYYQIPLTPRAQRYATFVTPFGSYRPLVMSFGLVNAPFAFSKLMATILRGCEKFCVPYVDDIAIFSDTWEDHIIHLDTIMTKLANAKLRIKPSKCKFAQDCVKYLGHMVGNGKRSPAEAKIQAVLRIPNPKTKTEIRKLLGMVGYYARYIEKYALLVEPLTRALKGKNRKEGVEWTDEMENAVIEVKKRLTERPVLYAPDYSEQFIVQTDASDKGVGVILAQRPGAQEHPVLYLSRKFSKSELNFATTEKECAAIIFAIKKLRHYLDGQKFIIETDHSPLKWLKTNSGNNPRLMRWALALQPYNYTVVPRPGKDIAHADCLSRL